jgi:hypothetical protein
MANIIHSRGTPKSSIITGPTHQMAGFFKIEVIGPDGRKRLAADWQPNLITNSGMDFYSTTNRSPNINHQYKWLRWCRLGTGNAEPQFTDTALDVHRGTAYQLSYATYDANQVEPYYKWWKNKYRFYQGQADGIITEIGIGQQDGFGVLSTRALIRDTNGDPTSIVITPDEQVDITYEMRCYIPDLTFYDTQALINGVLYDIKAGPAYVLAAGKNWDLGNQRSQFTFKGEVLPNIGPVTDGPLTLFGGNSTGTFDSYTPGSWTQTSHTTYEYDNTNNGPKGITAFTMKTIQWWQFSFTQNLLDWGIPHDNTNELFIRFRESWDRYTPP